MATPAASLQRLDRLTSEGLDKHRIQQVALANQQAIQEVDCLVNLLQHHLPSVLLSQPNLALEAVILAEASLVQNLQQVAASLDKATLLRRPSKVAASSVLQEEQLEASAQQLALDLDLVPVVVSLVATINSSSNSRSRSHSVEQLPPLEVSGRAALRSEPTITQEAVCSATLARTTLLLDKLSSSQLNKTHSAALGLKIKTRPTLNHPSEGLVPSSNKSRNQAVCSVIRLRIQLGEVVCLGT